MTRRYSNLLTEDLQKLDEWVSLLSVVISSFDTLRSAVIGVSYISNEISCYFVCASAAHFVYVETTAARGIGRIEIRSLSPNARTAEVVCRTSEEGIR